MSWKGVGCLTASWWLLSILLVIQTAHCLMHALILLSALMYAYGLISGRRGVLLVSVLPPLTVVMHLAARRVYVEVLMAELLSVICLAELGDFMTRTRSYRVSAEFLRRRVGQMLAVFSLSYILSLASLMLAQPFSSIEVEFIELPFAIALLILIVAIMILETGGRAEQLREG